MTPEPSVANGGRSPLQEWARGWWARLRNLLHDESSLAGPEQMYVRLAVQLQLEKPPGAKAKSILLTSPKSERLIRATAIELAYTVAQEMGRRVLLIDADMRPRAGAVVPGLTDVLVRGVAGLSELVRATSHERLFTLSAGSPELTGESLAGGRHAELLQRACAEYDSVIVMGAPALCDSRWLMLAPFVDHSLLVAEEGRTAVSDLDASLRVLAECKAAGVGVVLTHEPAQKQTAAAGEERSPALAPDVEPLSAREPSLRSRTDP